MGCAGNDYRKEGYLHNRELDFKRLWGRHSELIIVVAEVRRKCFRFEMQIWNLKKLVLD